ncbi:MAG: AMP-dependent synthetase and ligase, long-chain acyl-CoA synthetase [Deltaproteobacteria bacterium CSP1-8]|nr:MAG: AMP-dependent synthetase and ligase, long-chain acyl-CoA synthetase [Deltaproteobacteria bacterium CSP1-8]
MKEKTMNRMFLNRIEQGGDSVRYLVPRDGKWDPMTYREVGTAVREMANGLMAQGLSRGDKVAILSATRVEWCLADIAIILGGFVPVPIYPSNLPDQVEYILSHSQARAVFVENEMQWNKIAGVRKNLPALSVAILYAGIPGKQEGVIDLPGLRARGIEFASANPHALARRTEEITPGDDLTLIYTSGTTGPPKGVVTRHSNYVFIVTSALEAVTVRRNELFLQFLPLAHSLGRLEHFLTFDAMAVSAFARDIQTVGEDLALVRPEIMVSVPRLYEKFYARVLAKVEEDGGLKQAIFEWALGVGREVSRRRQRKEPVEGLLALKLSVAERLVFRKIRERMGGRFRFAISGGAPLSPAIAEFLHALGVLILEGYGLTEDSTVTAVNRYENYKFGTVGKALPGTEIRIAPDGEILVRGPHVFKEYFRDPEATREAVDAEGWLHTGDIGELDSEGFLRITDRKKDIIVTSGGKNVAPQNIENLLKNDKFVSQAFVYGDRRKYLTALITLSAEEVGKWAEQNGIPETDLVHLAKNPRVEAMMRGRVDEINRKLASFEQVKKYVLLGADFTQETGELTPTLKVKRKVVIQKYGSLLDALYEKD